MKYEAPKAEVVDLRAMDSVALLDGHPYEGRATRNGNDFADGSITNKPVTPGGGKPNVGGK